MNSRVLSSFYIFLTSSYGPNLGLALPQGWPWESAQQRANKHRYSSRHRRRTCYAKLLMLVKAFKRREVARHVEHAHGRKRPAVFHRHGGYASFAGSI
jgi:hypothetical protein